jgi:hypothetical protein
MNRASPTDDAPGRTGWLVLVYRVPSEPSSNRVTIWRDLKRIGALYLQQCVCIVPAYLELRTALVAVGERVAKLGGSSNLFDVPTVSADEEAALVAGFRNLVATQYAEIVEECQTKFVKEVEFEHFRQNYTFAEAEEIEQDLDKIRRWHTRIQERDWFGAPGRTEVDAWIARCAELLETFFAAVHAHTATAEQGPDAAPLAEAPSRPTPVPGAPARLQPLAARAKRRRSLG